jgi:hypothetical protein
MKIKLYLEKEKNEIIIKAIKKEKKNRRKVHISQ